MDGGSLCPDPTLITRSFAVLYFHQCQGLTVTVRFALNLGDGKDLLAHFDGCCLGEIQQRLYG